MRSIASRLAECGLTMHPEKSKPCARSFSTSTARLSDGPNASTRHYRGESGAVGQWLRKMKDVDPQLFLHWRVIGDTVG